MFVKLGLRPLVDKQLIDLVRFNNPDIFLYSYEESKKRYLHVKTIRYIIFRVKKKKEKEKEKETETESNKNDLLKELAGEIGKLQEASEDVQMFLRYIYQTHPPKKPEHKLDERFLETDRIY